MAEERIIKVFESVGIPKMQAVIYLDLLKNKESTATQISKRTRMHRANVYDTLTKLRGRNLVHVTNKEGKQVFVAIATNLIVHQEADKLASLKSIMDYINKAYASSQTPKVYTLEGLQVIKSILFSILDKKSEIWIYGLAEHESLIKVLDDRIMHSFHLERIKRNIPLKLLFYKIPKEEIKTLSHLKLTEARLLPKNQQSKSSQITQIICGSIVYITLWIHPVHTIVIENELIAKEYTDLYRTLWRYSKEIV